jgi:hypothetical protein
MCLIPVFVEELLGPAATGPSVPIAIRCAWEDRSKDRHLKYKGMNVFRFTGTEITRNPDACVDEVERLLVADHHRMGLLVNRV